MPKSSVKSHPLERNYGIKKDSTNVTVIAIEEPSGYATLVSTPKLKYKTKYFVSVSLPKLSLITNKPMFHYINNLLTQHKDSRTIPSINEIEIPNLLIDASKCNYQEDINLLALWIANILNIMINKINSVYEYSDISNFIDNGELQSLLTQLNDLSNNSDSDEVKNAINNYIKEITQILKKYIIPRVYLGQSNADKNIALAKQMLEQFI